MLIFYHTILIGLGEILENQPGLFMSVNVLSVWVSE